MRILQLNFEKTWRGGERQTLYCMQGFKKQGVEVALACRKDYPLEAKAKKRGFVTHSFDSVFQLIKYLIVNGSKYDVIHAQTGGVLTYAVFTKPFHRAKVVYTRRVDFVPDGFFTQVKYKLTDKLFAISNAIKNIIAEATARNAIVIPSAVEKKDLDTERAIAYLKDLGIDGKKVVATTAAFVQHKDPLTMVEAIKHLADMRDDFVFLHFGNGPLQAEVKKKIESYGLEANYKVMGYVDGVEDFFSCFDVFVMSSEEEGLGSSVLDAFIYKVPVVATNAGGLKELLQDNRGVSCNIKDAKAIAVGINKLLDADNTELLKNAYNYVQQEHDIDMMTKKYLSVFKEMLGK